MTIERTLLALTLLAALAGCAPLPEVSEVRQVKVPVRVEVPVAVPVTVPVMDPPDVVARRILAHHERVRTLPLPELQAEITRIGDPGQDPQATVELAMVLGHTRQNGDLQRAMGLLDGLLRSTDERAGPWQPWARLLRHRYGEQRRVEEQLEKQAQQLRETQRRLEQAQAQIEALRAIELSLTPRPAAPPASAPRSQP